MVTIQFDLTVLQCVFLNSSVIFSFIWTYQYDTGGSEFIVYTFININHIKYGVRLTRILCNAAIYSKVGSVLKTYKRG